MREQWTNIVGAISIAVLLTLGITTFGKTAISDVAGLAVAQTTALWNNVRDAAVGDNITNGILATSVYMYNGTAFDRVRGDTTNGLDVDVTRMPGGAQTPADAFANPTTFQGTWSLCGLFNGTTWDRCRGSITNGLLTEKKTVGTSFYSVKRDNIAAASVNLTYGFTSRKISIAAPVTNTDEVCVDWIGGTAVCPAANTAGDGRLAPGSSILLDDFAGTSISVIAASGTQTVVVNAWN